MGSEGGLLGVFKRWREDRRLTALIREGFGQTAVPIEFDYDEDAPPEPVPPELEARTVEAAKALRIAHDILGPERSALWRGWPLSIEEAETLARYCIAATPKPVVEEEKP